MKENKSECIKVIVRCRPISEKEIAANHVRVVDVSPNEGTIQLKNPKQDVREDQPRIFTFDAVYDWK
jgi:kinesin family protein 3/17